ncbi:hypothetical protein [Pedobacter deserti]|uniref:hypothetical protein n=1 Tax=Pedobacter deserti TaxID=2817382 RepID=UPI00210ED17C|nr:hypothetical protein [Pedobacter sp. SYSU D00382]
MYLDFLKLMICCSLILLASMFFSGCAIVPHAANGRSPQGKGYEELSAADQALADTLIKKVLDNEGLFTVIGRLKPISSAGDIRFSVRDTLTSDRQKLLQYQRVLNTLQFGDLAFVMTPFRLHEDGERLLQINVYRQSLVDSMVRANAPFYREMGYVAGADARLLINTTEYENKLIRFRSYGNLFGYPPRAVNFFVEAEQSKEKTGDFVARDFYQIPVHSNQKGRFVYALPKGSQPSARDEQIKARAAYWLSRYQLYRKKYEKSDQRLDAYRLLKHLLREVEK